MSSSRGINGRIDQLLVGRSGLDCFKYSALLQIATPDEISQGVQFILAFIYVFLQAEIFPFEKILDQLDLEMGFDACGNNGCADGLVYEIGCAQ